MPHKPGIGAIFGIVSEDGVAKPASPVSLYDRATMQLLSKTVTDGSGGYVFNGLDPDYAGYLVLATDEDGGSPKNALAKDRITPIPAHQGATFPLNWLLLARRLDAYALGTAEQYNNDHVMVVPGGTYIPGANFASEFINGTVTLDQSNGTPGASHIPTIRLANGTIFMQGPKGRLLFTGSESPLRISMEIAANTDADFTTYVPLGNANAGVLALQWSNSLQRMRILTWTNSDGRPSQQPSLNKVSHTYGTPLSNAVHHFVVTCEYGSQVKLYTDGVLTDTLSIAGSPNQPDTFVTSTSYLKICGILFGNQTSDNNTFGADFSTKTQRYGTGAFACAAFYPKVLTAGEVTSLYGALMVGSSPLATGYLKEIITDSAHAVYRLSEASGTTFAESVSQLAALVLTASGSSHTLSQSSPITGGSTVSFTGSVFVCNAMSIMPHPSGFSIGLVVNCASAAPGAEQILLYSEAVASSVEIISIRRLQTTGRFRLRVRQGGSVVSIDFTTYTPPASTDLIVAFVWDRVASNAKLYINGALQETVSVGGGVLDRNRASDFNANEGNLASRFMVGGYVSTLDVRSVQFTGKLGEVWFTQRVISASRVLAQYDARTTV